MTAALESTDDLIDGHLRALCGLYAALNGRRGSETQLSARELELATLAAATPLTYLQMAARLHVSESTVKTYMSRAFAKPGVNRRHQLQDALRAFDGAR
jgi:DNA-binding CsgD family transcriptional regulator